MKKAIAVFITFILAFCLAACSSNAPDDKSDITGVSVTDSGNVSVTFRVPDGMTVEDVLGSGIGKENIFYVSNVVGNSNGVYIYWYSVDNGGIVSCNGDIYRYGPKATVSHTTGVSAPPNWVMIYSTPSDDEIFNPEDAEKLSEEYGINLLFEK